MMTIDKKIKLTAGISVLVTLFFIVFLIFPFIRNIQKEAAVLLSQKNNLAEWEAKIENLKNFQGTYEIYQPNFSKINALFIDSREPISFIEFLEKEAADSQISIDITPAAPNKIKDDPWPSMNFTLSLAGSSPYFLNFFEKIESSPYLIDFLNLDIRQSAKEKGNINATLLIKVYTK